MATTETTFTRNTELAVDREGRVVNMSPKERWLTVIGGSALAVYGVGRRDYLGAALSLLGGGLIYWGATGHCHVYNALRINASGRGGRAASVRHRGGISVEKSVTINKPLEEVYGFWRNLENLPRFMNHLESVTALGDNRYRWVAKAPAGTTVEWDAEIYNERENEFIAWRSLEGSQIPNAGSVHFERVPGGRGTEIRVEISYAPPGGRRGAMVARLFGEEPEQQVEEDLRRLKQIMEAGEIASVAGQPSGRVERSMTQTTRR